MGIGSIGWAELVVIGVIVLVFFGPRRLPEIASTVGKSLREFRKALNEVRTEITQAGAEVGGHDASWKDYRWEEKTGDPGRKAPTTERPEGPADDDTPTDPSPGRGSATDDDDPDRLADGDEPDESDGDDRRTDG